MVLAGVLLGVLLIGLVLGLVCHSRLLIGDRRTVHRQARGLATEQQLQARTQATLQAMRQVADKSRRPPTA